MTKYNLGCGAAHIPDWINCDANAELKPDKVFSLVTFPWPIETGTADVVLMSHIIEHITKRMHPMVFAEVHRILKADGEFILSYPEFTRCAENYINNKGGQREYWEACIYGRQHDLLDTHVALMNSQETKMLLKELGFKEVNIQPEAGGEHNSIVRCKRGIPIITYEEDLAERIFEINLTGRETVYENEG